MKWSLWRSFKVPIIMVLVGTAFFSIVLWRAVTPAPTRDQPSNDPGHLIAKLLGLAATSPWEVSLLRLNNLRATIHRGFRFHQYDTSIIGRLTSLLSIHGRIPSCAVVGNSGILLRANHGTHIDSHTAVFRVNNASITGYASHVGSKTNFSIIQNTILHHSALRPDCFCRPYGRRVPILHYIGKPAKFLSVTSCNATSSSRHCSPIYITDGRLQNLCTRIAMYYSLHRFIKKTGHTPEEWHSTLNAQSFRYSSGVHAIMVAVGVCDRVSVFGFGKSSKAKHHYHDNQTVESNLHDYDAEYDFYHELSEQPHVVPFLKDSEFAIPPVDFYH